MRNAIKVLLASLAITALTITTAHAQSIVVPPLVARGAPDQTVQQMTALVSSELEFVGEFEQVKALSKRPSQLGPNCLGSTPCLSGIAKAEGSSSLLGGKVTKYGDEYEVSLVYLKSGKIARTVKRRMSTDPMSVADELAILVRYAITGVDPAAKAAEERVSGFDGGGVALMDDEEDLDDDALLMAAPAATLADPDALEDDPEEPEDDDFGYGAAAGAGAASLAASRSDAEILSAPATEYPSAAPAPDPGFSEDDITFGGSASDISTEDISFGSAAILIQVDEPPEDPVVEPDDYEDDRYREPAAPVSRRESRRDDSRRDEPRRQPRKSEPRSRPKRTKADRTKRTAGPADGGLEVTGKIGYARFQFLNFVTFGVEAAYELVPNIAVVGGLEPHATQRSVPVDQVKEGQPAVVWNTLMPINLGAHYRLSNDALRPYVGAGLQVIPNYVGAGGGTAFGFRAMAGGDYEISDNMKAHAGLTTGLWAGPNWYLIPGLLNTGFVVSFSTGVTMAF